jgi:tripartite-type tricarboxylate transporter receptor subunit TctC
MSMMQRSACALVASLLAALVFWAPPSKAEPWPQKTVHLIVPLPPGSATDVAARLFAERLSERWRQPVVVENRQGGDGIPAVTGFLAARDDHMLLFSFAGVITINPLLHDKLPYDPGRDLVPIVSVADNPLGIAASESLKVNSLKDLVTLVRAQPGKLTWAASPGLPHIALTGLVKVAGLDMPRAPYRDFNSAIVDLGEGRIHAASTGLSLLLPQVEAGRARLLAVTNRERSSLAPQTPTVAEAGFPELTFGGISGLYGSRDMPADLKERIAADVRAVAGNPAVAAGLNSVGAALRVGTTADFADAIADQRARATAILRDVKPTQ